MDTSKLDNALRDKRQGEYRKSLTPAMTPFNSPMPKHNNSNLEKTMTVATILKDLDLAYMQPIFVNEEVSLKGIGA